MQSVSLPTSSRADRFLALASFLAQHDAALSGPIALGQVFSLEQCGHRKLVPAFPGIHRTFRQVDPGGVFRNDFTERMIQADRNIKAEI